MEFTINIDDQLIEKIKEAIKNGGHNNASDFINYAIRNELEDKQRNAPSIDSFFNDDLGTALKKPLPGNSDMLPNSAHSFSLQSSASKVTDQKTNEHPLRFLLRKEKINTVSKKLEQQPLEVYNQDTIIWGQINRFLPMKIALNIIAQKVSKSGDQFHLIKLSDLIDEVQSSVSYVGDFFRSDDEEFNRKGSKKISVGFASGSGLKLDKGLKRFTSHFVVRLRKKDKKIEGALVKLGFIELYNMGTTGIKAGITDTGMKFLKMKNPVTERFRDNTYIKNQQQLDQIMSNEEITYLINTIKTRIPVDFNAMLLIMRLIKENCNTQSLIQDRLIGNIDFGSSSTMIDTNKNGVIARLVSLKLVKRNQESLNVEYALTKEGSELLSKRSN